jgi:hypothetical protein
VDLATVRVHAGSASAAAAAAINARAYTIGSDIHFAAGQYDPGSPSGKRLIAHEVAHTVQQSGATFPQSKSRISQPGDSLEQEADQFAASFVGGGTPSRLSPAPTTRLGVQRKSAGPSHPEGRLVHPAPIYSFELKKKVGRYAACKLKFSISRTNPRAYQTSSDHLKLKVGELSLGAKNWGMEAAIALLKGELGSEIFRGIKVKLEPSALKFSDGQVKLASLSASVEGNLTKLLANRLGPQVTAELEIKVSGGIEVAVPAGQAKVIHHMHRAARQLRKTLARVDDFTRRLAEKHRLRAKALNHIKLLEKRMAKETSWYRISTQRMISRRRRVISELEAEMKRLTTKLSRLTATARRQLARIHTLSRKVHHRILRRLSNSIKRVAASRVAKVASKAIPLLGLLLDIIDVANLLYNWHAIRLFAGEPMELKKYDGKSGAPGGGKGAGKGGAHPEPGASPTPPKSKTPVPTRPPAPKIVDGNGGGKRTKAPPKRAPRHGRTKRGKGSRTKRPGKRETLRLTQALLRQLVRYSRSQRRVVAQGHARKLVLGRRWRLADGRSGSISGLTVVSKKGRTQRLDGHRVYPYELLFRIKLASGQRLLERIEYLHERRGMRRRPRDRRVWTWSPRQMIEPRLRLDSSGKIVLVAAAPLEVSSAGLSARIMAVRELSRRTLRNGHLEARVRVLLTAVPGKGAPRIWGPGNRYRTLGKKPARVELTVTLAPAGRSGTP